jgi:hypothetical protein
MIGWCIEVISNPGLRKSCNRIDVIMLLDTHASIRVGLMGCGLCSWRQHELGIAKYAFTNEDNLYSTSRPTVIVKYTCGLN